MSGFIVCEIIYQFACRDMNRGVRLRLRRLKGELPPYLPGPIGHPLRAASLPKGSPLGTGRGLSQEASLGNPPSDHSLGSRGEGSTRTPSPPAGGPSPELCPWRAGRPGLCLPPGPSAYLLEPEPGREASGLLGLQLEVQLNSRARGLWGRPFRRRRLQS